MPRFGSAAWWFALAATITTPASGDDTPTELWLAYSVQQKVRDHASVFGSLGYEELLSSERFFGAWTKLYVTGGGSFDKFKRFRLAGGAGSYYTIQPEVEDLFELRFWQEGAMFWPDSAGHFRRFVFAHRLRLEERITESDGWDFTLRLRYRLEAKLPLNTHDLKPRTWYVPVAVELFANPQDPAPEVLAARSRLSVGLGHVINKTWTLDLRYHWQQSRVNFFDTEVSGHVIDFVIKTHVRIRDLIKGR
jgi:hypothetical protein